jgi:polyisoprenoid-binding protein YceI
VETYQLDSGIHDTTCVWDKLSGSVEADADTLVEAGAKASLTADMTSYDAGDFLKNRKLRKDLDVKRHPQARFELTGLTDVKQLGEGKFDAVAEGTLSWHGRDVTVRAAGNGTIRGDRIDATASFELNVKDLGIEPPKFLMFKVEEIVDVTVTVRAVSRP